MIPAAVQITTDTLVFALAALLIVAVVVWLFRRR